MDTTGFLDERELATLLKCSRPAIRSWRKGGLPHRRFGRLVRYELPEVLLWFEQRQHGRADPKAHGLG